MRIEHIIDNDIKARLGVSESKQTKSHPKKKRAQKHKQKPLSEREIKELMGMHRDTYKRKNGAIRRK